MVNRISGVKNEKSANQLANDRKGCQFALVADAINACVYLCLQL